MSINHAREVALAAQEARPSQHVPTDRNQVGTALAELANAYRREHPELHLNFRAALDIVRGTAEGRALWVAYDATARARLPSPKTAAQRLERMADALASDYPNTSFGTRARVAMLEDANLAHAYTVETGGVPAVEVPANCATPIDYAVDHRARQLLDQRPQMGYGEAVRAVLRADPALARTYRDQHRWGQP
jgi:hypothetical protein